MAGDLKMTNRFLTVHEMVTQYERMCEVKGKIDDILDNANMSCGYRILLLDLMAFELKQRTNLDLD